MGILSFLVVIAKKSMAIKKEVTGYSFTNQIPLC